MFFELLVLDRYVNEHEVSIIIRTNVLFVAGMQLIMIWRPFARADIGKNPSAPISTLVQLELQDENTFDFPLEQIGVN